MTAATSQEFDVNHLRSWIGNALKDKILDVADAAHNKSSIAGNSPKQALPQVHFLDCF